MGCQARLFGLPGSIFCPSFLSGRFSRSNPMFRIENIRLDSSRCQKYGLLLKTIQYLPYLFLNSVELSSIKIETHRDSLRRSLKCSTRRVTGGQGLALLVAWEVCAFSYWWTMHIRFRALPAKPDRTASCGLFFRETAPFVHLSWVQPTAQFFIIFSALAMALLHFGRYQILGGAWVFWAG